MKLCRLFVGFALLAMIGCGQSGAELAGRWTSVEFGGSDAGDHTKSVSYEFRPDGSFTASATVAGDEVQSYDGTYRVLPDAIEMEIPEKGANRMPYTLGEDGLTIREPARDSWVRLQKGDPAG